MHLRRYLRAVGGAVGIAAVGIAVAACTGMPATPDSTSPSPLPSPTATIATPAAPQLHPSGTAEMNLPYFTAVVQQVWAGPDRSAGRAYVDALIAAGFERSRMQVTRDQTPLGHAADSVQFAVAWEESCLVGQAGAAFVDPATVVLPILEGGACLVGDTRPIDW